MKGVKRMAMIAMSLCAFCACSDDNDSPIGGDTQLAQEAAGEYTGIVTINEGENSDEIIGKFTVTADNTGKVTLTMPEMAFGGYLIESFDIANVNVTDGLGRAVKLDLASAEIKDVKAGVGTAAAELADMNVTVEELAASCVAGNMTLSAKLTVSGTDASQTKTFTASATTDYDKTLASAVIKEHEGLQSYSVMGTSSRNAAKVSVKAAEDGTMTLSFTATGSGQMATRAYDITGIILHKAEGQQGVYSFKKSSYATVLTKEDNSKTTYTITDLEGTVSASSLNMSYTLKPGSMPFGIAYTFKNPYTDTDWVTGSYTGISKMSVMGQDSSSEATFEVTAQEDGTVTLTYVAPESDSSESSMVLGAWSIADITLTRQADSSNTYTFMVDSYDAQVDGKTYKFTNLQGTIGNERLTMSYNLQPGAMPFAIAFTFDMTAAE